MTELPSIALCSFGFRACLAILATHTIWTIQMIRCSLMPVLSPLFLILAACSSSDGSGDESTDSSSQRLVETTRTKADGSVDVVTTTYDESGNIFQQVFTTDGAITLTTTFETSPNGQFLRRSEDNNQDGIEDQSSSYVYDDTLGLTRINRIGSNSLIDKVEIYTFDDTRAVSRISRDIDDVATSDAVDESSGMTTYLRDFEYMDNRLSVINIDSDEDGVYDLRADLSYNPNGTLATEVFSSVTDGVLITSNFVYETGPCTRAAGNSTTQFFCIPAE